MNMSNKMTQHMFHMHYIHHNPYKYILTFVV